MNEEAAPRRRRTIRVQPTSDMKFAAALMSKEFRLDEAGLADETGLVRFAVLVPNDREEEYKAMAAAAGPPDCYDFEVNLGKYEKHYARLRSLARQLYESWKKGRENDDRRRRGDP